MDLAKSEVLDVLFFELCIISLARESRRKLEKQAQKGHKSFHSLC